MQAAQAWMRFVKCVFRNACGTATCVARFRQGFLIQPRRGLLPERRSGYVEPGFRRRLACLAVTADADIARLPNGVGATPIFLLNFFFAGGAINFAGAGAVYAAAELERMTVLWLILMDRRC